MKDITVIIPIHTNENNELELLQVAIKSVEDQQVKPEVLSIVCPKSLEKEVNKLASKYKFIKLKKKNYFDDAMNILDEDRSKTKDDTSKEEVKIKMKSYNPKKKINL